MVSFLSIRLQSRQQPGNLANRSAHRRQHVTLEFRIVGMNLGVGKQHRKLAGNILYIVDNKGKALAVLAQLLRL